MPNKPGSNKKKIKDISELKLDPHNINKGTEEGAELLDKSIEEVGFGKSIVVDKNNFVIAGNKTLEAALRKGKQKVKVIETNGDELIIHMRTDLDINSEKGAKMKILDNTTSKKNYVEDAAVVEAITEEFNLNAGQYGLDENVEGPAGTIKKVSIQPFKKTHVLISFPPERLVLLQQYFDKIMKIEGIEFEQSSN